MAFQALTPQTLNINCVAATGQAFKTAAVKDFANANVDFSSWDTIDAQAVPAIPGPASASAAIGTVSGDANGILTLTLSATDFSAENAGTGRVVIRGKKVTGDAYQLLASGTLVVASS